jgi:hypothetical protein
VHFCMPSLTTVITYIGKHFVFDEKKYAALAGATEQQKLKYGINHSALHFAKTAGKIAAVSEGADHGAELDIAELKENVPKALINTLKLAELIGMTEEEIVAAIEKKYGDKVE